ncbi:hypothetical protein PR048_022714 [Dryococelus australis]|uniref:FHA domain-containing protein n=1 Tax=Dryococelus australis TaxID=614101 RepID=A0ABQ9GRZ9_9NEOP|nr:hypothetical protein PR048_022714 [Dryococelus australis]
MEQRRNLKAGETEDPRENPPTSGIVRGRSMLQLTSQHFTTRHWMGACEKLGGQWVGAAPRRGGVCVLEELQRCGSGAGAMSGGQQAARMPSADVDKPAWRPRCTGAAIVFFDVPLSPLAEVRATISSFRIYLPGGSCLGPPRMETSEDIDLLPSLALASSPAWGGPPTWQLQAGGALRPPIANCSATRHVSLASKMAKYLLANQQPISDCVPPSPHTRATAMPVEGEEGSTAELHECKVGEKLVTRRHAKIRGDPAGDRTWIALVGGK